MRATQWLSLVLFIVLAGLQYSYWLGDGGVLEQWRLQRLLKVQRAEIQTLQAQNQVLIAEMLDLQQGTAALEERARQDLGMIGEGEVFYQIIGPAPPP